MLFCNRKSLYQFGNSVPLKIKRLKKYKDPNTPMYTSKIKNKFMLKHEVA